MSRREKKAQYEKKLFRLLDTYDRAFLVHADNVGSKQFQDIRRGLRPDSEVLMGKNTLMKRCIRLYCETKKNQTWAPLVDELVGNVGVVFTKGDLSQLKDRINEYKVPAPARVGSVAPNDVFVPPGPTGCDPSQTSFFQALGISTKINRGVIEITSEVHLVKVGEKVGGSEATLLSKLNIKPFKYGLVIQRVFESGAIYDPQVLAITDEQMEGKVAEAISNVAAACLQLNYPTLVSIPHSLINGYKNVLAVAVATDYSFPLADKIKEILANPEAFAAAAAAAAPAAGGAAPAAEAGGKAAAKEPEPEEESEDEDMGFSLFD